MSNFNLEQKLKDLVSQMRQEALNRPDKRTRKIILGWEVVLKSIEKNVWNLITKSHMGVVEDEDKYKLGLITAIFRTPTRPKKAAPGPEGPHEWEWREFTDD